MKKFQKLISSVLLIVVLGTSFGMITGCDSSASNHVSENSRAKEFPVELRVLAEYLADNLYADYDAAGAARKERSPQEIRVEMQTQKFDLAKIKSNNAEIQHLASEALTALSDAIKRLETIDVLPKPSYWNLFWAGFFDGALIASGVPSGMSVKTIQNESAKEDAFAVEVTGLVRAIKKTETAMLLLPRVARPYAAAETKSKNGDRIYVAVHEYPCWEDTLHVRNNGSELHDCVLEVKITGEKGDIGTSVFFIEKFESGQELFCILADGNEVDGERICRRTATWIKKAELSLLSPEYSTSVEYEYGQKERDDDYATMFKDVKLTARYIEAYWGIYRREARIYMDGYPRLPPCTLSVTFDGEGKTYSESASGWSKEYGWTRYGNNKSEDKCNSFSAEVTFPRTNFTIRETWTVDK